MTKRYLKSILYLALFVTGIILPLYQEAKGQDTCMSTACTCSILPGPICRGGCISPERCRVEVGQCTTGAYCAVRACVRLCWNTQ